MVAAVQAKDLLDRLHESADAIPLFVFDAGYDPGQMQQGLEGGRVQVPVRLRTGTCFYANPAGPPAKTGRSRRHGPKSDTKDPETWPESSAELHYEAPGYEAVRVRSWTKLPQNPGPPGKRSMPSR